MVVMKTPAQLLAWKPSGFAKMSASAAKGMNIAGSVIFDAGMINQARTAFGGASQQAQAASTQTAVQSVVTVGNATSGIVNALMST